ncbi:glycosyltransferase family 4 protein [Novosphingobium sediminicola]|uniref:Glycosyltransferase involved in cell wall biosynthesis n=1 Tax=Novosphingobium sediminicola TaxID=563162 RepID=A0A7W6CNS8_9SPHN|nr:glycosyltransferase family 4 protein [Novosphingobium sediminicola]MBB3957773.1 glycosyltransferase involved in cell wall biosynthesis [Novosphingobium sediminicola]
MVKHLALIDPLSRHGGMHYYDHDLANALVGLGVPVEVCSPPTGLEAGARYGVHVCFENVYGPGNGPQLRRAAYLLRDTFRALSKAHKAGCDTVLFHIFKSDLFEYLIVRGAHRLGMKCHAIVHDVARLDTKTRFEFREAIVARVDGLIVHNAFSRDALAAAAPMAAAKTAIMRHGNYVDRFTDLPSMPAARGELGLAEDQLVLLFFGNPRRDKGLDLLIEALVPLRDDPNLCLLVAGKIKPDDERALRAKLADKGLLGRVRLDIGHVPDDKVSIYYRAASIVVLPYLRIYESGVALMAMSFARTILASDLPAFQDLAVDGAKVRLFKAHDATSLTQALIDLRQGDVDLEWEGQEARTFVEEERSWARSAAALVDAMHSNR